VACYSKEKLRDLAQKAKVSNHQLLANVKFNEEALRGPIECRSVWNVPQCHSDGMHQIQKYLVPGLGLKYLL
jgi:hypothetical protein